MADNNVEEIKGDETINMKNLSVGQQKKLKAKLKKEAEEKAAAGGAPTETVEVPAKAQEETKGEDAEEGGDTPDMKDLSVAQKKKLKAKLKKEAEDKAGGAPKTAAPAAKDAKKKGGNTAMLEKLRL